MKRRKTRSVSIRTMQRVKAKHRAVLHATQQEIEALRATIRAFDLAHLEAAGIRNRDEAFARAQAIIADLLADADAPISAELKQAILDAIYFGIVPPHRQPVFGRLMSEHYGD